MEVWQEKSAGNRETKGDSTNYLMRSVSREEFSSCLYMSVSLKIVGIIGHANFGRKILGYPWAAYSQISPIG